MAPASADASPNASIAELTDAPIVVAEDSLRDREFVQAALAGFTLTLTDNGTSALRLLLAQRTANLLTDLQMPGLNGIELAPALWRMDPAVRFCFGPSVRPPGRTGMAK